MTFDQLHDVDQDDTCKQETQHRMLHFQSQDLRKRSQGVEKKEWKDQSGEERQYQTCHIISYIHSESKQPKNTAAAL
jgi:hypothetical protein